MSTILYIDDVPERRRRNISAWEARGFEVVESMEAEHDYRFVQETHPQAQAVYDRWQGYTVFFSQTNGRLGDDEEDAVCWEGNWFMHDSVVQKITLA